ncbi:MAG: DUF423 domain-containing protein [Lysinibacillus sp.]
MKPAIISGAIHGFLAVALGAFGAHALEDILTTYGEGIWNTAVQYQMFHAGGLLVVGLLAHVLGYKKSLKVATWCMNLGVVFFSGSLFALALTEIGPLGAITPIGGVLFLTAWISIIIAVKNYRA